MIRGRLRPRAAAFALAALLTTTTGCFGGETVVERDDTRLNLVVYVVGDRTGPWAERTEGLADGAKLAVADRGGFDGERALSVAVVPVEQRDGNDISAAFGAERVIRDSRALVVLGTYSAEEAPLAVPQINGAELPLIQFGSGMAGLTGSERRGEPERFEPSGERLMLRGVAPDTAVADAIAELPAMRGARVVLVGSDASGTGAGDDATRLGEQIAKATGGSTAGGRAQAAAGSGPMVLVTGAASSNPEADLRGALRRARGPVVIVDAFDRVLPRTLLSGRTGSAWRAIRTLADDGTKQAGKLRARSAEIFGRDRGDAVVAGYLAVKRSLDVLSVQPGRAINRRVYAEALTVPAPDDAAFPVDQHGNSQRAGVTVERVS